MKAKVKSFSAIIVTLLFIFIGVSIHSSNSSALEYQTKAGVNFTLLPSISVSLSSASSTGSADLVISDLLPNTSSDSNEIIVNVESNNSTGYVLNSSVGNSSTYASNLDNLVNTVSNNYKFTNLALDADLASIDDSEENNVWGYSYATYNTESSTWNTWSNYSGLPLYSDTTNIATLKSSNTPSSASGDNIGFKIAAKASITQGSGEYTNIINFIAVGNPTPTSFYDAFINAASQPGSTISQLNGYYKMQDMTADICDAVDLYDDNSHIQLIDTRDNEVYWIGKLKDNRCWLLDNLRLGSNEHEIPLTPQDTNIAEAWTLPRGITSNFNSYTTAQINAAYKDDTNVTSYGTASGKVGVYYNFCATSGGTYCHDRSSGTGDAQYDICPIGWKIPIGANNNDSDFSHLHVAYNNDDATSINSVQHNLSIPQSGSFYESSQRNLNRFITWSSKYLSAEGMYSLEANATSVSHATIGFIRTNGFAIRCIANNQ